MSGLLSNLVVRLSLSGQASNNIPHARYIGVPITSTGPFYTPMRIFGATSQLSLVNGAALNLVLTNGVIYPNGQFTFPSNTNAVVVVVRESLGVLAIEYPLTIAGYVPPPPETGDRALDFSDFSSTGAAYALGIM